jgi:hypothetical protein
MNENSKGVGHEFAPALRAAHTAAPHYKAFNLIDGGADPRVHPGQLSSMCSRSPGILYSEHGLCYRRKIDLSFLGLEVPPDAPDWSELLIAPCREGLFHG